MKLNMKAKHLCNKQIIFIIMLKYSILLLFKKANNYSSMFKVKKLFGKIKKF